MAALLERSVLPKQESDEAPGRYPELAKLVRQISGGLSSRVVARRTGVSHDTIARMWNGDRPSESTIIRFADSFDIDPVPLLEAAGYTVFTPGAPWVKAIEAIDQRRRNIPTQELIDRVREADRLEYIPDPDAEDVTEMVRYYSGLPPELRSAAKESIRALKEASDKIRQQNQRRTFGSRPVENKDKDTKEGGSEDESVR
jgi:transcriptional regulator with XRE-family HTH domain